MILSQSKTIHVRNRTVTSIVVINGQSFFKSYIAEDEPTTVSLEDMKEPQQESKKFEVKSQSCSCAIL